MRWQSDAQRLSHELCVEEQRQLVVVGELGFFQCVSSFVLVVSADCEPWRSHRHQLLSGKFEFRESFSVVNEIGLHLSRRKRDLHTLF